MKSTSKKNALTPSMDLLNQQLAKKNNQSQMLTQEEMELLRNSKQEIHSFLKVIKQK